MNLRKVLVALFLFIQGVSYAQTTLFSFGSTWKYLDNGSDQGTAWRQIGFDDSGWQQGPGQLGFGESITTQKTTLTSGYIGYYFRKTINIADISNFSNFLLEMYRDDGVVIYVNGIEIFRDNMPVGTINYNTQAVNNIQGSAESTIITTTVAASFFNSGTNTIAVEVHQDLLTSSDIRWDMRLTGLPVGFTTITTGPYLQKATSTSIMLRWYTADDVDSKVSYGTSPGNLSQNVTVSGTRKNHSVTLTNLSPYTTYYYSIETSATVLQSGVDNYFKTLPDPNSSTEQKYTFWVTGDVGNNSTNQRNVRDRFISYMGNNVTNGWLLLGDNAYTNGTQAVYLTNFFDIYEGNVMRKIPLWPATGNHEYENSAARRRDQIVAYFDFFDLPKNAEAGGVLSGTEAYYSFNYGNIHFIALDSYIIETVGTNEYLLYNTAGPQVQWLIQDLQANTKEWTIVYFHHPPYTMGSHNSDIESDLIQIRQNVVVPILEQYNVDLVLTGHSHSYERSKLMKGHSGLEASFLPLTHHLSQSSGFYDGTSNSCPYVKNSPNSGTVYAVAGSAGMLDPGNSSFPHDALPYANDNIGGSLILEIEGNRLDAKWLASDGIIRDKFTMMKNVNKVSNISVNEGQSVNLTASWVGQYVWNPGGQTTRSINFIPPSSGQYKVRDQYTCIEDVFNITVTPLPVELVSFAARVDDEKITLSWKTATELNNDYFEVQRFVDPEKPNVLAKVPGHGTTNIIQEYEYQDELPINGVAYYRLKQVDFDGQYEYSNIVRVNYDGTRSLKLYPNPGDGTTLNLALGMDQGPLQISVLDVTGRNISKSFTHTISDSNVVEVFFESELAPGMYLIQVKSNTGIVSRKWIVK